MAAKRAHQILCNKYLRKACATAVLSTACEGKHQEKIQEVPTISSPFSTPKLHLPASETMEETIHIGLNTRDPSYLLNHSVAGYKSAAVRRLRILLYHIPLPKVKWAFNYY